MTVMNRCGIYAAAVVGISSKFDVFAMLSATSMANALAAITAQNLGAKSPGAPENLCGTASALPYLYPCFSGSGLRFIRSP